MKQVIWSADRATRRPTRITLGTGRMALVAIRIVKVEPRCALCAVLLIVAGQTIGLTGDTNPGIGVAKEPEWSGVDANPLVCEVAAAIAGDTRRGAEAH